ncbi:hypothetical protein E4U46_008109, partial [Claviceps purpurea]
MTTKQTPLMKILLTSPLNAQLKPDIADKDTANFDDKLTTTTPTSLTNLKKEKSLPRTPMTTAPPGCGTSLVSTESHNKEENPPLGSTHAKERSAGLILVELAATRKKRSFYQEDCQRVYNDSHGF